MNCNIKQTTVISDRAKSSEPNAVSAPVCSEPSTHCHRPSQASVRQASCEFREKSACHHQEDVEVEMTFLDKIN